MVVRPQRTFRVALVAIALATIAVAWTLIDGVRDLRDAGARVASTEFQSQQALIARLAAERFGRRLDDVAHALTHLDAPLEPLAHMEWLRLDLEGAHGTVPVVLHDRDGHVLGVGPGVDPDGANSIRKHVHRPSAGPWGPGTGQLCGLCLETAGRLSVTVPVRGRDDLFVGALLDPNIAHETVFSPLAGPHDAYVWVMRADRTIVCSPDPEAVGSRPFDGLALEVEAELGPVLDAMARGDRGQGAYAWRAGERASRRLVAFEPVPGWPSLSAAHSSDLEGVVQRAMSVHASASRLVALLSLVFVALIALVAWAARSRLERERAEGAMQAEVQSRMLKLERLATLGQVAAGIGHEVKNPLTFVRANLDFLDDVAASGRAVDPAQLKEVVHEMRVGTDRILGVVSALGGLARVHTAVRLVDAREAISTAAMLARPSFLSAGIRLELDLERRMEVEVSPGELSQVFLNLLVNAAQACATTGRGSGRVRVSSAARGGEIRIEVKDDGPGIDPSHLERLFEPFFTTKGEGKGTGLGLAISREIVERFQGRIEVETSPAGTAFTVVLPAQGAPRLASELTPLSSPSARLT